MAAHRFKLAATGFGELPPDATAAELLEAARDLQRIERSAQWGIGDIASHQERYRRGGLYDQLVEATGFRRQTLRTYAHVSGRFSLSRRRPELTHGHHLHVASLPPAQADELLQHCVDTGLSAAGLYELVRERRAAANPQPPSALPVDENGKTVAVIVKVRLRLDEAENETLAAFMAAHRMSQPADAAARLFRQALAAWAESERHELVT